MRTDGRPGEGWEGAVQGREMLFHFSGWEGGGGLAKMLNRFEANRKSLPGQF